MTRRVPSKQVDLNQLTFSNLKDEADSTQLRRSIVEQGLLHPIVVWDSVIIDGNRRAATLMELGDKTVSAYVVTTMEQAVVAMKPALDGSGCVSNTWIYWGRLMAILTDLDSPHFAQRVGTAGHRTLVGSVPGKGSYFNRMMSVIIGVSTQTIQRWRKIWDMAANDPDEAVRRRAYQQVELVSRGETQMATAYGVLFGVRERTVPAPPPPLDLSRLTKTQKDQRDLLYAQLATISGAVASLAQQEHHAQLAPDILIWRRQINAARSALMGINRQLKVLEDQ